jgi:NhaA family Na+:H+ antiporter
MEERNFLISPMLHFIRNRILHPLQLFFHDSRAVGITLLVCTAVSLLLANTGSWQHAYRHLWSVSFDGTAGHHMHAAVFFFPNSPLLWINDGLMAVFFFLVGMEIRREMTTGELASFKKSALPVAGAIGGMIVPALLYFLFNKGTAGLQGWAIPTATDIAFTLGVASLLGKRVPAGLKIFLTALAIIDDLGAIVVIALFYGAQLQLLYIAACILIAVILWLLNRAGKKPGLLHVVLGLLLWYCMFNSGIHATVAGVLFAFMLPVSSLTKLELRFHKPVYFLIMPLFALANTAIGIPSNGLQILNTTVSWGILAGLCIGKPLGICTACYFLTRKKMAELPSNVDWHKMAGAGLLAGIGFTMSIFISTLAFPDPSQQDIAKIAVLIASFISMTGGFLWIRFGSKKTNLF